MLRKSASSFAVLLALLSIPSGVFAYTSPGKPTGYLNDFAHVLSAADAQALEGKLKALHAATGDDIVAVTVSSLDGDTVENYAVNLFQEWGIGNEDKDNGLLILVSTGDHEARIEVGYGLEGTVTDLQSGNIIRNVMIPAFKDGGYAGGIAGGVDAIGEIITGSPDAAQYSTPAGETSSGSIDNNTFGALFFFGFIILNMLIRVLGRTRSWWLGGVLGAGAGVIVGFVWGFGIGVAAVIILTILGLIFDYIVSRFGGPRGPGGMGGFWPIFLGGKGFGGSNGSGGFGGFGGGSSGGGGASGKW